VIEPRLLAEAAEFVEPVKPGRTPHTHSRLVILKDGTFRPVLLTLADWKFGAWDRNEHFPFWVDGDPSNETLANVDLAIRLRNAKLGIPGGPGYAKRRRELLKQQDSECE
jgi:hypothetical protein